MVGVEVVVSVSRSSEGGVAGVEREANDNTRRNGLLILSVGTCQAVKRQEKQRIVGVIWNYQKCR
jgi:hypothetical protein